MELERNKTVTVRAGIPRHIHSTEFELELSEWLIQRGYTYQGLVEVVYEEEKQ